MKTLVLGRSSIARRRVLPALASLGVDSIDLASRGGVPPGESGSGPLPPGASGRVFDGYAVALEESDAELVYVSTVNSTHAELVLAALDSGRHVVVDKPAAIRPADVERILERAREKARVVAESVVWGHHPQVAAARGLFEEVGSRPTRISAVFSFPPLPPDNFRYRPELGGGALWDLGPYAVSAGRLFFGEAPVAVECRAVRDADAGVDTAFSVIATYSGGRSLTGQFGMTTGYVNRLDLLGPDATVSLDPGFTTPPEREVRVAVNQRNERRVVTVPPADTFALFLGDVLDAIAAGDGEAFATAMRTDAAALARLRASAADQRPGSSAE